MADFELPKQFVAFLRTLFDILDEDNTGFIRIVDIETRWQADGTEEPGLPSGVLESLRKVTPPNGKLSFERFVAGHKISLLRSRSLTNNNNNARNSSENPQQPRQSQQKSVNPPKLDFTQRPLFRKENIAHFVPKPIPSPSSAFVPTQVKSGPTATAAVPPNNTKNKNNSAFSVPKQANQRIYESAGNLRSIAASSEPVLNEEPSHWTQRFSAKERNPRWSVSGQFGNSNKEMSYSRSSDDLLGTSNEGNNPSVKRRDSRRHTLTNGIDYNLIKRMKQFEQERDVLRSGLAAVENAREWYNKCLADIDQRQKYAATSSPTKEQSSEDLQDRINFQNARIREVNHLLETLMNSSNKELPAHMNLAVSSPVKNESEREVDKNMIKMLKEQNKMLTQESAQKSERLAQLEHEKAQLIREIFKASSSNASKNYDDTTFI